VALQPPSVLLVASARGPQPQQMSTSADEIEFGITRLPRGGFKATVHISRGDRWWPPDAKLLLSDLQAIDIDARPLKRMSGGSAHYLINGGTWQANAKHGTVPHIW
jgi:hypothetical protein